NGRLQHIADAAGSGRYLDVYYGADGRISTIADNSGRQVGFTYGANGTLTAVTDPLNHATNYTYVTSRFGPLLTRISDNWGRTITDITYDTQGRTATYTENGETYTYTYNYNNQTNQSSKVDSAANRWIYTYSSDGPITRRDYPNTTNAQLVYNGDKT